MQLAIIPPLATIFTHNSMGSLIVMQQCLFVT